MLPRGVDLELILIPDGEEIKTGGQKEEDRVHGAKESREPGGEH